MPIHRQIRGSPDRRNTPRLMETQLLLYVTTRNDEKHMGMSGGEKTA
jgi:hypothetical protein